MSAADAKWRDPYRLAVTPAFAPDACHASLEAKRAELSRDDADEAYYPFEAML